jgi:GT2 family glycosyltransferase
VNVATRIVIVIVTYKNGDDAVACLKSLALSTHQNFEVHICENGGAAAFAELADRIQSLKPGPELRPNATTAIRETRSGFLGENGQTIYVHLAESNLGYAGGVNAVLSLVEGDPSWSAIWVLNPDTVVDPDALTEAIKRAAVGGYGVVGSRLVLEETGRIHLYGGRWRRWMARGFNLGLGAPSDIVPDVAAVERDMDYVCGAAMLVSRSFIEAVGPMDDRYFLYCEEVDWCLRRGAFKLGYAHNSIVYHTHGTTTGASVDHGRRSDLSVYLEERNKLLLSRRHFPQIYPLVLIATLLLTTQYLAKRQVASFKVALEGWMAGLSGEEGIPRRFRASHDAGP